MKQLDDEQAVKAIDQELYYGPDPNIPSLVRSKLAIQGRDAARNLAPAQLKGAEIRAGMDQEQYQRIFARYLLGGVKSLDEKERQILQTRKSDWAIAETSGPNWRAQGVASGPIGGYLVPRGFMNQIEESLKHYSAMRQVSTVMTTAKGNDLHWPSVDDTAQIGERLAENAAATEQDVTFAEIVFKAYKYSSKIVRVSRELVEDSGVDLEAVLASLFARRIGVLQNQEFTTGTGTGQPSGVVMTASLGKVGATGQTTSVLYNDLVDLVHSVDPLYRVNVAEAGPGVIGPSTGWMMNDATFRFIRTLDTAGKPVDQPTVSTFRPMLLGFPVVINPNMPVMAASAKSILFGDFSRSFTKKSKSGVSGSPGGAGLFEPEGKLQAGPPGADSGHAAVRAWSRSFNLGPLMRSFGRKKKGAWAGSLKIKKKERRSS